MIEVVLTDEVTRKRAEEKEEDGKVSQKGR
jgi:hypothetical protein